jgi:hypothetical protein
VPGSVDLSLRRSATRRRAGRADRGRSRTRWRDPGAVRPHRPSRARTTTSVDDARDLRDPRGLLDGTGRDPGPRTGTGPPRPPAPNRGLRQPRVLRARARTAVDTQNASRHRMPRGHRRSPAPAAGLSAARHRRTRSQRHRPAHPRRAQQRRPDLRDLRRNPDHAAAGGRRSDGSSRDRRARRATRCRQDRDGNRAHRQACPINARARAPSPAA